MATPRAPLSAEGRLQGQGQPQQCWKGRPDPDLGVTLGGGLRLGVSKQLQGGGAGDGGALLPSPRLDQGGQWGTDGAAEAQAHLDGSRWQQGARETVGGGYRKWVRVPGAWAGQLGLPGTEGWGLTPGTPLSRLYWSAATGWGPGSPESRLTRWKGTPGVAGGMLGPGVKQGLARSRNRLAGPWLPWPLAEKGFSPRPRLGCS